MSTPVGPMPIQPDDDMQAEGAYEWELEAYAMKLEAIILSQTPVPPRPPRPAVPPRPHPRPHPAPPAPPPVVDPWS